MFRPQMNAGLGIFGCVAGVWDVPSRYAFTGAHSTSAALRAWPFTPLPCALIPLLFVFA
jgi:hypothetical protein